MRSLLMFAVFCMPGLHAVAMAENFDFKQGLIGVNVAMEGEASSLRFILDSGAEETVLDLTTAKKLGLSLGSKEAVQGVGSTSQGYRTQSARLEFAGIALAKSFLAVDLSPAARQCRQRVDGLLGADFFRNRVVRIDYGNRIVTVNGHATPGAGAEIIPISRNSGAMCVPLKVGDNALRKVRVDTGSCGSLDWSPPLASTRSGQRKGNSIGLSSGDGAQSIQTIQLGDRRLGNVRTVVHQKRIFSGEDGLLGNALLRRFIVTFDMANSRLILED